MAAYLKMGIYILWSICCRALPINLNSSTVNEEVRYSP